MACRRWRELSTAFVRKSGAFINIAAAVDQNFGQRRHWLPDDEFQLLAKEAANLAAPVLTAPSTEAETEGCLIVDPSGNVLQPTGTSYLRLGNCLEEPLDQIWAKAPMQSKVIDNKLWLSVLS